MSTEFSALIFQNIWNKEKSKIQTGKDSRMKKERQSEEQLRQEKKCLKENIIHFCFFKLIYY
jgi:hypothetical protein